ncbi:hypothetical protein [Alkalibacillus haloalkaliphilus]|uniref:hypothetical protein n=1 Tax=Alkalibacillus haloalkaliphilus TaxID=94136 RepID=UPI0029354448|nr:hypothetical protein [Alkalibacillus haloalkaliphilus]MDV2581454.1 hypothetical protein [Alkalibacillus haloalkaliphilus]
MGRLFKRVILAFIAVLLVLHPLITPVVHAVGPWSGEDWEGNPWEGDPWDGSQFQWQGEDWEGSETEGTPWESNPIDGTPWEGETGEGNPWNQDGFNNDGSWSGYDWQLSPWYLNGWSQPGMNGDPWSNDGFVGDPTQGSPWANDGFLGNETDGNPWSNEGFYGSDIMPPSISDRTGFALETGNSYEGGQEVSLNDFPTLPESYDIGKFVLNDVMMGQVNLMGDLVTRQNIIEMGHTPPNMNYGIDFRKNLVLNGLRLGVGDHYVFDTVEAYETVNAGVEGYRQFTNARAAQQGAGTLADVATDMRTGYNSPASLGALSKFNVAAAAVGTGFSAFETGFNTAKAVDVLTSDASGVDKTVAVSEATGSLGSTVMNAGVVVGAIPGMQAAGGIMIAGGAAVWVASRGTRFVANHWKGNVKDTGKAMWNTTKETAKNAWGTVKGWFS